MSEVDHLDPGVSAFALPPNWDRSIVLKDDTVNVSGLSPRMVLFLTAVATVHKALFSQLLCVTSGNDGVHVNRGKHGQWKAVDLRCVQLGESSQLMLLMVLAYMSRSFGMAVFDERRLPGAAHFHVEEAG